MTPVIKEPLLGYHPCDARFLTSCREPAGGQCQAGSLTGAVASERVSGAQRFPQNGWKPFGSTKNRRSLTATPTGGAGTKMRLSDRWYKNGMPSLNG